MNMLLFFLYCPIVFGYLFHFFPHTPVWEVSTDLSLSSLILSSPMSRLLMSPSKTFFFQQCFLFPALSWVLSWSYHLSACITSLLLHIFLFFKIFIRALNMLITVIFNSLSDNSKYLILVLVLDLRHHTVIFIAY